MVKMLRLRAQYVEVKSPIFSLKKQPAVNIVVVSQKTYGGGGLGEQTTKNTATRRNGSDRGEGLLYFNNYFIQGSFDFVFGYGRSPYKRCYLHSIATKKASLTVQKRTNASLESGFSFKEGKKDGVSQPDKLFAYVLLMLEEVRLSDHSNCTLIERGAFACPYDEMD
ncbi:hypothetical protein ACFE04_019530 [Oxalis oulophora]